MKKIINKCGIAILLILFGLSVEKAESQKIPQVPKLGAQRQLQTEAEAEAAVQGAITNLCYWFAKVSEIFGKPLCAPEECTTPAGFNNCLQKVGAWLEPEYCTYLKSELHNICDVACTRITCLKTSVLEACKTACCPLNVSDIKGSCMGKKDSCPFPPIVCGKTSKTNH